MLWAMRISEEPYQTEAAAQQSKSWGTLCEARSTLNTRKAWMTDASLRAHLWWIPEMPVEGVLQVGVDVLVNGHAEKARRLKALLLTVPLSAGTFSILSLVRDRAIICYTVRYSITATLSRRMRSEGSSKFEIV